MVLKYVSLLVALLISNILPCHGVEQNPRQDVDFVDPNFSLSFSPGSTIDQEVGKSIAYYAHVSNWIWHAVTAGNSTCDYKAMTFRSLEVMESHLKLLMLEKLNSGNFSDALSVTELFNQCSQTVSSSYTWGDTKTHVRSIIQNLGTYVRQQSSNFFITLLQTNQFSKAYSLATAYRILDERQSNEWIANVQQSVIGKVEELTRESIQLSNDQKRETAMQLVDSFRQLGTERANEIAGTLINRIEEVHRITTPMVSAEHVDLAAIIVAQRQIAERLFGNQ